MKAPSQPIKLLAIDIDGTLLNPHKQLTRRTRDTIRATQEIGTTVTLATARRYCNTQPIATKLGIEFPLVICDGALIIQHPQGTMLHTQPIPAAIAQEAVE